MQPSTPISPDSTDDIALAEQQVALRKAELARSLRAASRSGQQLAARIGSEMKPAFIAATAVAGAAVLVGVGVVLFKRRKTHSNWLAPERPTALATALRGAGLWLARIAARRLAQEVVQRLGAPAPETTPGHASVATTPDQV